MQSNSIDINSSAIVRFTATLEKMHKSALPVAVRQTLSKAAFDVKQHTMPNQTDKTFEKRQQNFFKANSKVVPAQGLSLTHMAATVGFVPLSGTNKAVDDLQQQEYGGNIDGRSFIPLPAARSSGSWRKKVKSNRRIANITAGLINSSRANGKNTKQRFVKSAVFAGKGGFVLGDRKTTNGSRILFEIRSIIRKNGDTIIKAMPIYAVKGNRKVNPPATRFMHKASVQSAKGMESIYMQEAQKQINKYR